MRAEIDQYVIDRVRAIRNERGKTQEDIAEALNFKSTGYIAKIESYGPDSEDFYNIKHLNAIAKLLTCSPRDFFRNTLYNYQQK